MAEPDTDDDTLAAEAVRTLAQYRPFDQGSAGLYAAHDDLVTAACEANAAGFAALEACRVFITDRYKVELELSEVRDARDRLIAAGSAKRAGGGIVLTEVGRAVLAAQREAWLAAEAQALLEWEASLRTAYPGLTREDIDTLKEQLRPWLDRVLAMHGAEAGLLLYPDSPRCEQLVRSLASADLSFLPPCRPELSARRAAAFRMFVRMPTDAQRTFLGRLLNTAFYLTVLSIDPRAQKLAAAEMAKTVLYLDTNFLYSVLGVGSPTEAFAAKRFLELCKELGITLRISPWTVDELRTSIASSRRDVERFRNTKKTAAIMAEVTGEKGFVPAYWRAARDSGEAPEAFFGKFGYFMRFLEVYGIVEHPEEVKEVEADVDAILDYASPLEGMFGPGARPREVIEHDAKMRLLVERLRAKGKPVAGYTDVRYWFITESTRLPTYARRPISGMSRPDYPFCILASTWAQIMRAMVPRTDDLDGMLVGLLSSPYVGYRLPLPGIGQVALERVVSRIDSLSEVPPAVAIAMVNDRAIASKVGGEISPDVVDRVVTEALTEKAAQLEAQIARTAEEAAEAEQLRVQAEARASQAEAERVRLEGERDAVHQAAEARRTAYEKETLDQLSVQSQLEADLASARADSQTARDAARRTVRRVRNVVAVGACVLFAAAAATLIATNTIQGVGPIVGTVAAVSLLSYLALRLVSKGLANEVVIAFTVVAGAASLAGLFAQDSVSAHPAPGTGGASTSTTTGTSTSP